MAAKKTAAKTATKTTAAKPAKTNVIGINDLAKHMKLKPATVRKALRDSGMKKPGKAWVWSTKTDMEKVAKKLAA